MVGNSYFQVREKKKNLLSTQHTNLLECPIISQISIK